MNRKLPPLLGLRVFECVARHLSFTRAAIELCVTQAAISHQVKALEERLGLELFRRTPRGLVLTDEGRALMVPVGDTFERLSRALGQFEGGRLKEVLTVGAVSIAFSAAFGHDTVWSYFGDGYGFIPVVLPMFGLGWLWRHRRESAGPVSARGT